MSKQWVRQEVKKNEIADVVEKAASWTQANRQQAIAGAGVVLVLLILGGYFFYQRMASERTAWRTLAIAQSLVYQGQPDQAIAQLQNLSERFNASGAWGFGVLLEGDVYFRGGQYAKAVESYQKIIDRQSPKALIPFALSGQGLAQEASKDYTSAVDTDRRFLDRYKDHFLAPQTHASLARCFEALKRKEEAKAAYQQMSTLYPDDAYWRQWAETRLKAS